MNALNRAHKILGFSKCWAHAPVVVCLLAALALSGCIRLTAPVAVAVEIKSCRPFLIVGEVAAPGQYPYVPS